ncbi:MAG: guanylate kinase [Rhodospirillales bacterium]|jgi:guanylate kinase|nr:guanylate kinase [Rhodospirillales bacterium]
MLALSSPSGAGKTTISRELLRREPGLTMSISATTRAKRPSELAGKDYDFVDQQTFDTMVAKGQFLEHARVFDHCYGTPKAPVMKAIHEGRDVLFDVDWQGTQQLSESTPDDLVCVFVLPPSTAELESRLRERAQDSDAVVERRMTKAADEMSHYFEYDYIIVNRDVDESVNDVQAILRAERLKRTRQAGLHDFIVGLRGER